MNRRRFLKIAVFAGVVLGGLGAALRIALRRFDGSAHPLREDLRSVERAAGQHEELLAPEPSAGIREADEVRQRLADGAAEANSRRIPKSRTTL